MYAIVVGGGSIGYYLARGLLIRGNEVTLIERDPVRANARTEDLGSIVVTSDGTEPNVLRDSGAARADVVSATPGDDGSNLVACQVAKHLFNVPRTMSVVWDPDHARLFDHLGVDVIISATDLLLANIEEKLSADSMTRFFRLHGGDRGVVGVHVPPGAEAVGRAVADLDTPMGAEVAAIVRGNGRVQQASAGARIEEGDEVIAVVPLEQEEALWQTLTRQR